MHGTRIKRAFAAAAPAFIVLWVLGTAGRSDAQVNAPGSSEAQKLSSEMSDAYSKARELTLEGDQALFLPGNKIGDSKAAAGYYGESDKVLEQFFKDWDSVYQQQPALFAMLDLLYIENTRGYAYILLAQGNTEDSAKYRQDTVDMSEQVLDSIGKSTWDNPQFPYIKTTLGRWISEAHLFLALDYQAKGDAATSAQHLQKARETAVDPQSKALIDQMIKR